MRYTAIADNGTILMAAIKGERVVPLVEPDRFYRDLSQWTATELDNRPSLALAEVKQVPAVYSGARVLCVGLNYRAHAKEGGFTPPEYPAIFGRWTRSLIADGDAVPALDDVLDWEGELAAVVGTKLADADAVTALAGVFGYAAFNDISARTFQRHTHQWTPGKNMDCSGVFGSVVTADEVGDPANGLLLETRLNGRAMQSARTSDMIFSVGDILAYLSRIMTLYPGDIIVTGTPEGVGYARTPPILMKPGDTIAVSIDRVGSISNPIVSASERRALT